MFLFIIYILYIALYLYVFLFPEKFRRPDIYRDAVISSGLFDIELCQNDYFCHLGKINADQNKFSLSLLSHFFLPARITRFHAPIYT